MLLVSGCSYICNPYFLDSCFPNQPLISFAQSGAGNQYIADSILSNLHDDIEKVFVLWTGFNRIDIPFSSKLLLDRINPWHKSQIKNTNWLHSGGMQGGLSFDELPKWLDQYLKQQYLPLDWDYLVDQNLRHVVGCLNTLEVLRIDYAFGFIYDIHQDYSDRFWLGGPVPKNHNLLKSINWNRCISTTPYEFCLQHNLLDDDNIHPSYLGYKTWWNQVQKESPFSNSSIIVA
jgi:hypothetical protein